MTTALRMLKAWVDDSGAHLPPPESELARMLLDEDHLDMNDLMRLYRAIAIAAGYIDFIGPGVEGHQIVDVRVNDAWTLMKEDARQEEMEVLASLVRPHLRRWHGGVEPLIRISHCAFGNV